jgi:hypothetical protein
MQDAKNLHADITKLLIDLEQAKSSPQSQEQVITVQMEGGSF